MEIFLQEELFSPSQLFISMVGMGEVIIVVIVLWMLFVFRSNITNASSDSELQVFKIIQKRYLNISYKQYNSMSIMECTSACMDIENTEGCLVAGYNLQTKTCYLGHNGEYSVVGVSDQNSVIITRGDYVDIDDYVEEDGCDDYLISGPEGIPDESLTATSSFIANSEHFSRLNNIETQPGDGAWSALKNNLNQWIQARVDTPKTVKGIAIQGRDGIKYKQYVSTFSVSYSTDCSTFHVVSNADGTKMKFTGNTDFTTIVTNMLPAPVTALCVRLHPITYFGHKSLRWDIIGC